MLKKAKIQFLIFVFCSVFINPCVYAKQAAVMGRMVGIKIYTDGVVVTGTGEFLSADNQKVSPARDADIKIGDIITAINGSKILTCEDITAQINQNPVTLNIERNGEEIQTTITPTLSNDNTYKLGVWLRDSLAGVGTLTCVNPDTNRYYALGHAITDIDTGNIMTVNKGSIQNCNILEVSKSSVGAPGAVNADFLEPVIGDITSNSNSGISGYFNLDYDMESLMDIAMADEVQNGDAYILTDVVNGTVSPYAVKIKKVSDTGEKNLVVEICDENLKSYTGGIVQGMSGSPIIQNNKLVGAITHVFVNNPKCGYGILAEKFMD